MFRQRRPTVPKKTPLEVHLSPHTLAPLDDDATLRPSGLKPVRRCSKLTHPRGIGRSNDFTVRVRHGQPYIEGICFTHTRQVRGDIGLIVYFRRKRMRHHLDIAIPFEHESI